MKARINREASNRDKIIDWFISRNYKYVWLKAMLEKGSSITGDNCTLITGPSYGAFGIEERAWDRAVNCSVDSQDLYYSFLSARKVIEGNKRGKFARCIILAGYFTPFSDLSLSEQERERIVVPVFYPIFHDGHNWEAAYGKDLWDGASGVPEEQKAVFETEAISKIQKCGTYFSSFQKRVPFYQLDGKLWRELSPERRMELGQHRAQSHNKSLNYQASMEENKRILQEYVHFLHLNEVMPVFAMCPVSEEYRHYLDPGMCGAVHELISSVQENVFYYDVNEENVFNSADFLDTDHMNAHGAHKFSMLLSNRYGR